MTPQPGTDPDGAGLDAGPIGRVTCIGGAVVDSILVARTKLRHGTSNPVRGVRGFGGVARNVAVNLRRLGASTSLCSVVGDDADGSALIHDLDQTGVGTAAVRRASAARTASYVAILEPDRSLHLGAADMAVLDTLSVEDAANALRPAPDWVFADCNCPAPVLAALIGSGARVAVDAVSAPKVERLPERLDGLALLFLNLDEAAAALELDSFGLAPAEALRRLLARGPAAVILTLGPRGVLVGDRDGVARLVPAVPAEIVDVTGAGDALIAGSLAGLLRGLPLAEAASLGTAAAAHTLRHAGSTSPHLSAKALARPKG